jgi:undecaprenyl-diphosphatase
LFCDKQLLYIFQSTPLCLVIILAIVDKKAENKNKYEDITFKQSLLIGMSQAIAAAFPGVSRSGITMTVARSLKIDRESAAKFSFLLSTPIVAAAVLVDIAEFALTSIPFWIGVLSSFVVGLIVVKFLMDYLKKGSFKIFAIYRIILGVIILGLVFLR